MREKLLICGDSFAVDWSIKNSGLGWVNMLEQYFNITNMAQAGCSEYKILKQLKSVNLGDFDKIIVSHTSPYRLYIKKHPIHNNKLLHKNSCLIYVDILEQLDTNPELKPIVEYFEKYFDLEYAEHIHNLLLQEIDSLVPNNTLHLSHIDWKNLYVFNRFINFKDVFAKHSGNINHYNEEGNNIVYLKVLTELKNNQN